MKLMVGALILVVVFSAALLTPTTETLAGPKVLWPRGRNTHRPETREQRPGDSRSRARRWLVRGAPAAVVVAFVLQPAMARGLLDLIFTTPGKIVLGFVAVPLLLAPGMGGATRIQNTPGREIPTSLEEQATALYGSAPLAP